VGATEALRHSSRGSGGEEGGDLVVRRTVTGETGGGMRVPRRGWDPLA